MQARFIGKNSMGFENGRIYDVKSTIKIYTDPKSITGAKKGRINIMDTNSGNWCPYDSLESVLKNWQFGLV